MEVSELLRLVSSPNRKKSLDNMFGYEVTAVLGFNGEPLIVNIDDYKLLDENLGVYRLKDEFSHNKYR